MTLTCSEEESWQSTGLTCIWYVVTPGWGQWRKPGRGGRYRGPGAQPRLMRQGQWANFDA